MAVFCDQTGVRIVAPSGDEAADVAAYRAKTGRLRPVSVDVDPENGWDVAPPTPAPDSKTTAAPPVERAPQPAAKSHNDKSATDAPKKGKD